MIKVKKMCGDDIVINANLIETIQSTPDTVITMTTHRKILVKDSVEEVVNKAIAYQKSITGLGYSENEECQ